MKLMKLEELFCKYEMQFRKLQLQLVDYLEETYPYFKNYVHVFEDAQGNKIKITELDRMKNSNEYVPKFVYAIKGKDSYVARILKEKQKIMNKLNEVGEKIRFY